MPTGFHVSGDSVRLLPAHSLRGTPKCAYELRKSGLATSREGLSVADEQIWPVRSLDVDVAANLFVERAHSVAPGFSADEADAVVEICQRLDGIPLAIELAASRISSMTASDVRDRLDQRFKLLVGVRRGLDRHQTLRQAVQWSYDLLDDAEKALLARCCVFSADSMFKVLVR